MALARDYLAIVRALIQDRFPDLETRRLPCGGYVYYRPGQPRPAVHILFSPLPKNAVPRLLELVGGVHPMLGEICRAVYVELLEQFNGASFLYPSVALYGLQAPREINIADVGYAPFQLHTPNFFERGSLPATELMIGVTHEQRAAITVDAKRVVRLRPKNQEERPVHQFSTYEDLLEFLLDRGTSSV